MAIEFDGKVFEVDEEGFLEAEELASWVPEVANVMAKLDDTELSDEHWEVLRFLREYYDEYQVTPAVRVLAKHIGKKFGREKGNDKYLGTLFPYGIARQAAKYSGLRRIIGTV